MINMEDTYQGRDEEYEDMPQTVVWARDNDAFELEDDHEYEEIPAPDVIGEANIPEICDAHIPQRIANDQNNFDLLFGAARLNSYDDARSDQVPITDVEKGGDDLSLESQHELVFFDPIE